MRSFSSLDIIRFEIIHHLRDDIDLRSYIILFEIIHHFIWDHHLFWNHSSFDIRSFIIWFEIIHHLIWNHSLFDLKSFIIWFEIIHHLLRLFNYLIWDHSSFDLKFSTSSFNLRSFIIWYQIIQLFDLRWYHISKNKHLWTSTTKKIKLNSKKFRRTVKITALQNPGYCYTITQRIIYLFRIRK